MTDVTPPLDPEPADLAEDAPTPTHEMVVELAIALLVWWT